MVSSPDSGTSGVLVLATLTDWWKAVAMVSSMRLRGSTLPVAVVGSAEVAKKIKDVVDHVVVEAEGVKGFYHKLLLDKYSPFDKTLFVDSDMLWFQNPLVLFEKFAGKTYGVRGYHVDGGVNCFGFDQAAAKRKLGLHEYAVIDGAGHAYFEKTTCEPVFERAREIAAQYGTFAPGATLADEDVMAFVMNEMGIAPLEDSNVVGFVNAAQKNTLVIDVVKGECHYVDLNGRPICPALIHFPRNINPFLYARLMRDALVANNQMVNAPLFKMACLDWFETEVKWRLAKAKRAFLATG